MKKFIIALLGISFFIACSKEDHPPQTVEFTLNPSYSQTFKIVAVSGDTVTFENNTDTIYSIATDDHYYSIRKDSGLFNFSGGNDTIKFKPKERVKLTTPYKYNLNRDTITLYRIFYNYDDFSKNDTVIVDQFLPIVTGKKF
jgi:hypothetical protein